MATKQKAPKKKPASNQTTRLRRLKAPQYRHLRLSKRLKHPAPQLPSGWHLLTESLKHLRESKRLFAGIIVIYGLLTLILVGGLNGGLSLSDLKASLHGFSQGHWGQLSTGLSLFGLLLGSTGSSNSQTGGLYQSILIIVISLALIWSLRQTQAGHKISLRDAFYKSLYPLIPFLLVILVIGLQLIPLVIGNVVYSTVITNGIAVTAVEKIVWGLLFFLLALLSIYLLSSSLFALYIVTLPDMTPLKALRSARELVRYRRWTVLRKIIFLPVSLLLAAAVVVVPLIIWLTATAPWAFFGCTMVALAVFHSYMYGLYRELL